MTPEGGPAGPERLQKFLSRAGVASRRMAEELIGAGRVSVNGAVVRTPGEKIDALVDEVTVDGAVVRPPDDLVYLLINKPTGVVTTLDDPQGRPTVAQFVPKGGARLFPVGRLDLGTSGLLLLTNDGELAHMLMHPRYHVPKTYRAHVDGIPDAADLKRLRTGIDLDDGRTAPAEAALERVGTGQSTVLLTLREGRKRQVRRMLSAIGHPVNKLTRVAYGPLSIGSMAEGEARMLSAEEVRALRESAEGGE